MKLMWQNSATRFGKKLPKSAKKSQKTIFLISAVRMLLGNVDLHLGIDMDMDFRKSVTRFGKKSPKWQKSATRCGKKSPKGGSAMPGDLRAGTLHVRGVIIKTNISKHCATFYLS